MPTAVFVFDIGGSECQTTLDVENGLVTPADTADRLRTFMNLSWVPYMATQCTFREVRFDEAVSVADSPGEGETNALPASCALIMQKNTGTSVRGRMFLPGLAEADTDAGGRVGSELRGLVDTAFAARLADLIDDGISPRVVTGAGGPPGTMITAFTARPLIATLRNRIVTR